jgi:hypothetical protein
MAKNSRKITTPQNHRVQMHDAFSMYEIRSGVRVTLR